MKRIFLLLSILFCTTVFAHTIEWYVGDTLLSTTTCESGDNITPPTAPAKTGYHFKKWLEYTPVEYLRMNGGYINTGITLTDNVSFFARTGTVRGNVVGMTGIVWQADGGIYYRYSGAPDIYSGQNYYAGTLYNVSFNMDRRYFMVNNNKIQKTYTISNSGVIGTGVTEIVASLKIWDNGTLVRDMIPVLDKNGNPCMYDIVEDRLYYSANSNPFLAGPVVE